MPTEDRRKGKLLPSPVTPESTVCFKIQIPNAVHYRAAFLGQINVLGQALIWDHPTDGTDCIDCEEAAQLWRNAIFNATWSDDCGDDPMTCADIEDCIENDAGVRTAINEIAGRASQPGTTTTPGQRLSDESWSQNLTPTDDCDFNAFWSQCTQFVEYVVQAGADMLEMIEVYSNAVEAAQFIEMAPFIGTVVDEVQLDKAIQFFDWSIEIIKELYDGANTQPNRTLIACALFCGMRAQCEMSLEQAFNIINARAGGVFTPSSLNSLEDLINAALTITTNPALPLDTFVAFALAAGRVMGYLGVQGINQTLNIILKIAVNNSNDAWILLCEDCPPEMHWGGYLINAGQPADTNVGTANDDGLGHVTFTGGFSYGAYRVQQRLVDNNTGLLRCFKITSLTYGPIGFPNNLQCDGVLREGPPELNECYLGIVGADLNPFTIEMTYELC